MQKAPSEDTKWKKYSCNICGKQKIINGQHEYSVHLASSQHKKRVRKIKKQQKQQQQDVSFDSVQGDTELLFAAHFL